MHVDQEVRVPKIGDVIRTACGTELTIENNRERLRAKKQIEAGRWVIVENKETNDAG